MNRKATVRRGKPADASGAIDRLYNRLVYWLYERQDVRSARPIADRLTLLLTSDDESIFAAECRSLIHEAKGNLPEAIEHRRHEIERIRRLHQLAEGAAGEAFLFRQYNYVDLKDRLVILAMLYHSAGRVAEAIGSLHESKELCEKHGLAFDDTTILREYQNETRAGAFDGQANGRRASRLAPRRRRPS